ncbi:MAG: hypothetical protein OEL20_05455 [Sulfuritalea sp.]|nr:hypothetical protein [Sulfuritalea sp.]
MRSLILVPLALLGLALLSGCAGPTLKEQQSRGNMIVIARYDSRFPEGNRGNGRVVTDNAGGAPSAVAGAAGLPTSPAGGAVLNVGAALAANLIFGDMAKDEIKMAFKVLYENGCEYGIRYLDLRKSPEAQKLYPGYMARVEAYKEGVLILQPVTDGGKQVYLTKSHPCYATWVTEWKEHQRVLSSKTSPWDARRFDPVFGSVPLDRFPDPQMDWVK